MAPEPKIHNIFEPVTGTWQYIVADPDTRAAVLIDAVLDYSAATNALSSTSADKLLSVVEENGYNVVRILETHVAADHITAAKYLQTTLEGKTGRRPPISIGKRVEEVQKRFAARYGIPPTEYADAFDHLLGDAETFTIGKLEATTIHLPGHTPDHLGYQIGGIEP